MSAATFDGMPLFASATSTITVGEAGQVRKQEHFPGVDGVLEMRLGKGPRPIRQAATFLTTTSAAMIALIEAVEAYTATGAATLVDDYGRTFENVSMQAVRAGPIIRAGGTEYVCRVEVLYLQLAPNAA